MASSPTAVGKAPTAQFLVIPMKDSVELNLERAETANTPGDAKAIAERMALNDELEHPVVVFMATQMVALTKKPEVIWQPRGAV